MVDLDQDAVSSTLSIPPKVIVKPDVVLSTLIVGADVSPEATGAAEGLEETGSADEGDSEGVCVTDALGI